MSKICPKCGKVGTNAGSMSKHIKWCVDFAGQFWQRIRRGAKADCWPWLKRKDKAGYGRFDRKGPNVYAHRIVWRLMHGPVPPGLEVMHRCDVRFCCNPSHLYLGTHQDNMDDMARKGRSGVAVLTLDEAREVKQLLGTMLQSDIAKKFGVGDAVISNIKRGKAYGHVQKSTPGDVAKE